MEQSRESNMAPMHVRLKVALAGVVLSTSIVTAQQAVRPAVSRVEGPGTTVVKTARQSANAAAQRAAKDIRSLINGVAIDSDQTPLPNATIRLRNLDANEIEQVITANEMGEFSFIARPDVAYVVEIADQAGRIVAVGDVIMANAGEVAGAIVALPSRLPALAGVFGDTASSVMSAATGTGLTVVDPTLPKVSPSR
jgi:hypothetical protein